MTTFKFFGTVVLPLLWLAWIYALLAIAERNQNKKQKNPFLRD